MAEATATTQVANSTNIQEILDAVKASNDMTISIVNSILKSVDKIKDADKFNKGAKTFKNMNKSLISYINGLTSVVIGLGKMPQDVTERLMELTKDIKNDQGEVTVKGGEMTIIKTINGLSKVLDSLYSSITTLSSQNFGIKTFMKFKRNMKGFQKMMGMTFDAMFKTFQEISSNSSVAELMKSLASDPETIEQITTYKEGEEAKPGDKAKEENKTTKGRIGILDIIKQFLDLNGILNSFEMPSARGFKKQMKKFSKVLGSITNELVKLSQSFNSQFENADSAKSNFNNYAEIIETISDEFMGNIETLINSLSNQTATIIGSYPKIRLGLYLLASDGKGKGKVKGILTLLYEAVNGESMANLIKQAGNANVLESLSEYIDNLMSMIEKIATADISLKKLIQLDFALKKIKNKTLTRIKDVLAGIQDLYSEEQKNSKFQDAADQLLSNLDIINNIAESMAKQKMNMNGVANYGRFFRRIRRMLKQLDKLVNDKHFQAATENATKINGVFLTISTILTACSKAAAGKSLKRLPRILDQYKESINILLDPNYKDGKGKTQQGIDLSKKQAFKDIVNNLKDFNTVIYEISHLDIKAKDLIKTSIGLRLLPRYIKRFNKVAEKLKTLNATLSGNAAKQLARKIRAIKRVVDSIVLICLTATLAAPLFITGTIALWIMMFTVLPTLKFMIKILSGKMFAKNIFMAMQNIRMLSVTIMLLCLTLVLVSLTGIVIFQYWKEFAVTYLIVMVTLFLLCLIAKFIPQEIAGAQGILILALSLAVLSGAMLVLAYTCKILADVEWGDLAKLGAILVGAVLLCVLFALTSGFIIVGVGVLALLSLAMLILSIGVLLLVATLLILNAVDVNTSLIQLKTLIIGLLDIMTDITLNYLLPIILSVIIMPLLAIIVVMLLVIVISMVIISAIITSIDIDNTCMMLKELIMGLLGTITEIGFSNLGDVLLSIFVIVLLTVIVAMLMAIVILTLVISLIIPNIDIEGTCAGLKNLIDGMLGVLSVFGFKQIAKILAGTAACALLLVLAGEMLAIVTMMWIIDQIEFESEDSVKETMKTVINALLEMVDFIRDVEVPKDAVKKFDNLRKISHDISRMAINMSNIADLKFETKWDSNGNPTEFRQMTAKDFQSAARNASAVLTFLSLVVGEGGKMTVGEGDSAEPFDVPGLKNVDDVKRKTVKKFQRLNDISKCIFKMTDTIAKIASLNYADKWDEQGNPIHYQQMDAKTFGTACDNAVKLATAMVTIMTDEKMTTFLNTELKNANENLTALQTLGGAIGNMVDGLTKLCSGQFAAEFDPTTGKVKKYIDFNELMQNEDTIKTNIAKLVGTFTAALTDPAIVGAGDKKLFGLGQSDIEKAKTTITNIEDMVPTISSLIQSVKDINEMSMSTEELSKTKILLAETIGMFIDAIQPSYTEKSTEKRKSFFGFEYVVEITKEVENPYFAASKIAKAQQLTRDLKQLSQPIKTLINDVKNMPNLLPAEKDITSIEKRIKSALGVYMVAVDEINAIEYNGEKLKSLDSVRTLINDTNKVTPDKFNAVAKMFEQVARLSESIRGNFSELADAINDQLMDILKELKDILDETNETVKKSIKVREEMPPTPAPAPGGGTPAPGGGTPAPGGGTPAPAQKINLSGIQTTLGSIQTAINQIVEKLPEE